MSRIRPSVPLKVGSKGTSAGSGSAVVTDTIRNRPYSSPTEDWNPGWLSQSQMSRDEQQNKVLTLRPRATVETRC